MERGGAEGDLATAETEGAHDHPEPRRADRFALPGQRFGVMFEGWGFRFFLVFFF